MHPTSIDTILWLLGIVGEVLLVTILLFRRSYRIFPIFCAWALLLLLTEPTFYWVSLKASQATYDKVYFALNFPQYLLEAGVLAEIALNVTSPVKRSLSKPLMIAFATSMGLIAICGFLVAATLNASTLANPRAFMVINTTMAILRLATFLLIAGFSQVLGLNWKNHVLQLASGLAFYAIITLIVDFSQSHLWAGPNYASEFFALDHLRIAGYLCALYFWCYAFAKKEAPRKEFSPQMTKFLVSISGSTKRQRAVLARTRN
ncbi:MAG TPA: hypothetical protein VFW25_01100 [Silvibacterium sp.]|nr:hypothetical protein [Silvibacterium sp.]